MTHPDRCPCSACRKYWALLLREELRDAHSYRHAVLFNKPHRSGTFVMLTPMNLPGTLTIEG